MKLDAHCNNFAGSPDPAFVFTLKLVGPGEGDHNIGFRIGIATGYVIGTVLDECAERYAVFDAAPDRAVRATLYGRQGRTQVQGRWGTTSPSSRARW